MILAFDTASRAFSVALFRERVIASVEFVHEIARSQSVVQTVDRMLGDLNLTVNDLEAVYAGLGPGSFTGVRIGLAFANTLLQTRGIPLLGVPTLDLLAFESGGWYNSAVSLIRSRKSEVYAALYKGGNRVGEYLALEKGDFLRFLREARPERLVCSEDEFRELGLEAACAGGAPWVAVSGEAVSGEAVSGEAVPGEAVPGEAVSGEAGSGPGGDRPGVKAVFAYPRAASAFSLVRALGLVPGHEYLKPLYVRDSHAIPHIHG